VKHALLYIPSRYNYLSKNITKALLKKRARMALTKAQIVDEIHPYMFWDSKKKTFDVVEPSWKLCKKPLRPAKIL
jgi:hypothetical protein